MLVVSSVVVAQPAKKNCNLADKLTDNGITLRRYNWTIARAAIGVGTSYSLIKFGVPEKIAAVVTTVGFGLIPHTKTIVNKNASWDTVVDFHVSAIPLWIAFRPKSKIKKTISVVTYVGIESALICYQSP